MRRAMSRTHAVYTLAPGLLLVFKPRGHREAAHAHDTAQRLRVLRGVLDVRTARGTRRVTPASGVVRIAAGRMHATTARADTWLIAERVAAPTRRPRRAPPPPPRARRRRRRARRAAPPRAAGRRTALS